jgi:SAM-dependent methyltransferase
MANETERRRWNDEQTVANWPKRERFTDRVVPHVVAALKPAPGDKVLDIGSGGGKLSLAIAQLVQPGGKVVGADISSGMVRMATERAAEAKAKGVTFVAADVQSETVAGGPFDGATSQFGVMFFDDPVAAFANIRRQLKPGGQIAFACWQPAARNVWNPVPPLAPFVPAPTLLAGKSPTGPFALGDARRTRGILSAAGFRNITRTPKRMVLWMPSDVIANDSQLLAVPEDRREAAKKAMTEYFDQFRRDDGLCRFELNFQIFTAARG